MADFGVYIHYPWCRKLCSYCDFPVTIAADGKIPDQAYYCAVLRELDAQAHLYQASERTLLSIYFGGGTPSRWPASYLGLLIAAVADRFGCSDSSRLEVTLEANPTDCTPDNLARWQQAGFNRLSIGVQSFDSSRLAVLGRDHCMGDGQKALAAASDAGFENVSADLILGAPTTAPWRALESSVVTLAGMPVEHISVYELTIEAKTHLGRDVAAGRLRVVDDERLADAYIATDSSLTDAGFEHYEVSSYARPARRAVHNSLYWKLAEYLGLGCGASSFLRLPDGGGRRWTNDRSVRRYMRLLPAELRRTVDSLSSSQLALDRLWLGLRTRSGVMREAFSGRESVLDWLFEHQLVLSDELHIIPTLRGFLYSDRIARRILSDSEPMGSF